MIGYGVEGEVYPAMRPLIRAGASYAVIVPVDWVRQAIEPQPDGALYVDIEVTAGGLNIRPVGQLKKASSRVIKAR